ncbi:MAG: hypothetical protein KDA84_13550, partial [Planctomycetaceae bacterium]|nr:hypothetical protein [Planctomycetaceae bacterium]
MNTETSTVPVSVGSRSNAAKSGVQRRFCGFLRWCIQTTAWGIGLGCILAILLRLTWKDSIADFAPFFYATPLPLVWIGLA